jgi:hypothetical protein
MRMSPPGMPSSHANRYFISISFSNLSLKAAAGMAAVAGDLSRIFCRLAILAAILLVVRRHTLTCRVSALLDFSFRHDYSDPFPDLFKFLIMLKCCCRVGRVSEANAFTFGSFPF